MTARKLALEALVRMDRDGAFSNLLLDSLLGDSALDARNRRFVSALVYGVTERKMTLDYFLKRHCKKLPRDPVLSALRLGIYQLYYMKSVPQSAAVNETVSLVRGAGEQHASGFVNAVLRAAAKMEPTLPDGNSVETLSIRYSVAPGLLKELIRDYGLENAEGILAASLSEDRLTHLRANTLKITAADLAQRLSARLLPGPFQAVGSPGGDPASLPEFSEGLFHVQDLSSQLCCALLNPKPGDLVFDACAAPGGKSFTLAQMMENRGKILAAELHPARVNLITSGARRLGIDIINAIAHDSQTPLLQKFDRILCDVPCSGFGLMGKKPEIRYKNVTLLDTLPEIQYRILCVSSTMLMPGGRLIYSTCTLRRAENQEICSRFLRDNPDFSPVDFSETLAEFGVKKAETDQEPHMITLLPQNNSTDGFFIAAFRCKHA